MSGFSEGGASVVKKTLKSWTPLHLSAKSDIEQNLKTLKARAADLAMNSALGSAIINSFVTGVVGSGLKLFPRVKADVLGMTPAQARAWNQKTKAEFELWSSEPLNCDFLRRNNFYELQSIIFQSALTDGDCFALFRRRVPTAFNPYTLRLQAIDGLRVSNPNAGGTVEVQRGKHRIINGIELNRDGCLEAVWIANRLWNEPSVSAEPLKWQRVRFFGQISGCKNVLQIAKDTRPDQCRGVPLLAPVIEHLKQISRLAEAELGAAIVRSFFAIFFTQEERDLSFNDITGTAEETSTEIDASEFKLDAPSVTSLPAGVDVKAVENNKTQSSFAEFMESFVKQAGAAVGLPFECLLKNFQSSYSASRAALIQAENIFRQYKNHFIVDFCAPTYEQFLTEAITLGRIDAPKFFDDPIARQAYLNAQWLNERSGVLDPLKEVNAQVIRLQNGLSTYERELAEMGMDFEDVAQQLKTERELLNAQPNS